MDWKKFAVQLFATEDADPGYVALAHARLPEDQKKRFMAAWVTYYHPGIAAQASEYHGDTFWKFLLGNYEKAPRASERRHFRGRAGQVALDAWRRQFKHPEEMVDYMRGDTYFDVREHSHSVPQIGPYFVWKFADVQERVFRDPCDFTGAAKYSPKVPQDGAKLISKIATVEQVYARIVTELNVKLHKAPPWHDRSFTIQEAETVCCVYHQYIGGGYWPMSRTAKMILRLAAYPCSTSSELIHALRPMYSIPGAKRWAEWVMSAEQRYKADPRA